MWWIEKKKSGPFASDPFLPDILQPDLSYPGPFVAGLFAAGTFEDGGFVGVSRQADHGTLAARRSRYLLYWSAVKKTSLRSWDSGSGQIFEISSTDTRRSSRRKSFLTSVVTEDFTTRRSMKTAFAERAGTWWRGGTNAGGRWEQTSRPADPRRALAYGKEDVYIAIFTKIGEKQGRKRKSSWLTERIWPGVQEV
jgi:hypothetical protein